MKYHPDSERAPADEAHFLQCLISPDPIGSHAINEASLPPFSTMSRFEVARAID